MVRLSWYGRLKHFLKNIRKHLMRIFEIFNIKAGRSAIKVLCVLLGILAAGSVYAASMTVAPSSPVAKPNAATTVDVKFVGRVLVKYDFYQVCAPVKCYVLYFPVKLYAGSQLTTPYFSGPVTCVTVSQWLSNGITYYGCENPVVKVTIPAKSAVGQYAYTVTHDEDTFTNSTTANFVVKVGTSALTSTILPLLLN